MTAVKYFNTILELQKAFKTEQSCIEHLEELRWGGGDNAISPFDSSSKVYKCKNNRYRCKNTGKYFNVKTGTMFENTKVPLRKWFIAIWLVTTHKKGISSNQLKDDIGVTQKTAWFMLQRIRKCFDYRNVLIMDEIVEMDETYMGGKAGNMHYDKRIKAKGVYEKVPVFGIVQRKGLIRADVVDDASVKTLIPRIYTTVEENSLILTDEHKTYQSIGHSYIHRTVNHSGGKYVKEGTYKGEAIKIHTNTIEGFWSIMKRGIYGIYHWTSKKHLQKYINEFTYRYNTRRYINMDKFNVLVSNMRHRTTYRELVGG